MRPAAAVLALVLALAAAACASGPPGRTLGGILDGGGWQPAGISAHAALREGVEIVWWARGVGGEREKVGALREGGAETLPASLQELQRFTLPIDGPDGAKRFASLARLLGTPGLPMTGTPVEPDDTLTGRGSGGSYSRSDAASWGITFDAPAEPNSGGWLVEAVLLVAPTTNPDLHFTSPWRLVWTRCVVYPDATITVRDQRTLTNGDDAARFARF